MIRINGLVILCLARLATAEDRISVDTVGTITATAGYAISDGVSPTASGLLKSNVNYNGDASKDSSSSSSENYGPVAAAQGPRGGQSLALRSRQARGKTAGQQQWSQPLHDGSGEDAAIATYHPYAVPADHHRVAEQLYSVKPQTFDNSQSSSAQQYSAAGGKSSSVESSAESSAPITYGKKKNDEHDDRPVYVTATAATATAATAGDWSEEVRLKYDGGDKATRSRKKHGGQDKSRRAQAKRPTVGGGGSGSGGGSGGSSAANSKEGWQEVSPNMEMATGYSATVPDHDSSHETSDSAEFYLKSSMGLFQSASSGEGGVSSAESAAPAQNFNHKQVLSKMNHFDFSNAVSQANKAPPPSLPPREKRLNYQPGGPPVRLAFGGGQPLQAVPASALPPATAAVKSVKVEQPQLPNYHSIVVPMPVSHQMYAAMGGDGLSGAHSHNQMTAGSSMQQAMMSLPVVHNVFFKTDENGGGKTMPAIVIPLKPEYLQHLQQQQYLHMQQQHSSDDSQNAAGHQRPVHHSGPKTYQQYQQQQQLTAPSLTPSPYAQQKPKPAKAKKPFGLTKDEQQPSQQQQQQQPPVHRVKQPFGLQHQFYSNPFHHAGHQQLQHGHHAQHETIDDARFAQSVTAPAQTSPAQLPFPLTAGHSMMIKRPHAYGYASPVAMPPAKFVQQVVNKAHQHQLQQQQQQQQQQQLSAEDLASLVQQQVQQPFRATTFHPGFAYLSSPDADDYPYRPIFKDMKKRNDAPGRPE